MSYVTSILKRWKFHWEVWRFFLPPHSFYIWRWGYYGSLCRAYDEMVKYFIDKTTPLYKETFAPRWGKCCLQIILKHREDCFIGIFPTASYTLYFFSLLEKDHFYRVLHLLENLFKDFSVTLAMFKFMIYFLLLVISGIFFFSSPRSSFC